MSPCRARRTRSISSTAGLLGAALEGSFEPWDAFPEAGSVIIARLALSTNSQMVGLPGEIFGQADQAGAVSGFRQALQALPGLLQILMDDFQRFGQGFMLAQQFQYRRKRWRFPIFNQFLQSRLFRRRCALPEPQYRQSQLTL